MKTIFESTGSQYERQGDYILSKLKIKDKDEHYIGILGQRYYRYLKKHHCIIYYNYLKAGTLYQHLSEANKQMRCLIDL